MNFNLFGFTLTLIAGLSTLIGFLVVFIKGCNKNIIITFSLAFSAGVMIYTSLFELLKESFIILTSNYNNIYSFLIVLFFINMGIIISVVLDLLIAEKKESLYKVGIISMIALMIHNIPEGIVTYITSDFDKIIGIKLAFTIAMHNIPEGICIAVPIYYISNKTKAFKYTFLSGISEPIGALIAFFFLKSFINETLLAFLYSITAGIMLYISFYELIKEAKTYKNIKLMYFSLALGFIFMYIVLGLF